MAKDYFQDIVPPSDGPDSGRSHEISINTEEGAPVRGIRSIQLPSRSRPSARTTPHHPSHMDPDMRESSSLVANQSPPRRFSGWLMWLAAALSLLVLCGLALFAFRPTTITVTPKSRLITLTDSLVFIARPDTSPLVPGASPLPYSLQTSDLEDSEVVPSQGTSHVESKASGSITVYNEYSAASVRLIKNTRFESPEGLIFRIPADVVIPGKNGGASGQVQVSIVADQVGEKYNIAPASRFTLPGLKSGDMYSKVYAKSTSAMVGGFVGEQPGTTPGALNAAIATVRTRLEAKARATVTDSASAAVKSSDTIVFPELMKITYQSEPNTIEAGSGVRIHEKAHVEIPVFPNDIFSSTVAQSAFINVDKGAVSLIPGEGFSARVATSSSLIYGVDPITFILKGKALIVWRVDAHALALALAGHDSGAFPTIVNGFSGIQEAHARIEPLWKKTFPTNAANIKINIQAPKTQ